MINDLISCFRSLTLSCARHKSTPGVYKSYLNTIPSDLIHHLFSFLGRNANAWHMLSHHNTEAMRQRNIIVTREWVGLRVDLNAKDIPPSPDLSKVDPDKVEVTLVPKDLTFPYLYPNSSDEEIRSVFCYGLQNRPVFESYFVVTPCFMMDKTVGKRYHNQIASMEKAYPESDLPTALEAAVVATFHVLRTGQPLTTEKKPLPENIPLYIRCKTTESLKTPDSFIVRCESVGKLLVQGGIPTIWDGLLIVSIADLVLGGNKKSHDPFANHSVAVLPVLSRTTENYWAIR